MSGQSLQKNSQVQLPKCINKREAKLVCLNDLCQQYPFFCTDCPNDQCQIIHQHGNKLQSVSFKQYTKRVLKQKKMSTDLQQIVNRYRECLIRLQKDVEQFVKTQLHELDEIKQKCQSYKPQDGQIIKKLKMKQYESLKGLQLDKLWHSIAKQGEGSQQQKQTIQFLKQKQQQIIQISKSFESVNQIQMNQQNTNNGSQNKNENFQPNKNAQEQNKQQIQNPKA